MKYWGHQQEGINMNSIKEWRIIEIKKAMTGTSMQVKAKLASIGVDDVDKDVAPIIVGSYLFDGLNDVTRCGDYFDFATGDFTIAFWTKPTDLTGSHFPFCKGPFNSRGYYIQYSTTKIGLVTNQQAAYQLTESDLGTIELDKWQHYMIVLTGSDCKIYKNNSEVTYNLQGTHINPQDFTWDFRIGCYHNGAVESNHYEGYLTDIRLFSKALNYAERSTVYNKQELTTALEGWYKCDETSGLTANDSSGNDIDGTHYNITEETFFTTEIPT